MLLTFSISCFLVLRRKEALSLMTSPAPKEGGLMSLFGKRSTGPTRQAEPGLPLHAAVYSHDKSALKKLLEKENPEKTDSEGHNALHAAVSERDSDMVSVIIKKKMNYDMADKHKRTPLLLAAEMGDIKSMEILSKVCSLDAKDAKGNNVRYVTLLFFFFSKNDQYRKNYTFLSR